MRRENGTGSVYKRSDRKNRPWWAVAPTVFTEEGKQKPVILGQFRTRREAENALNEFNAKHLNKNHYHSTFKDVYDMWSNVGLKDASYQCKASYETAIQKTGLINDKPIRELRTADMQSVVDQYLNMSHSTLNNLKKLFSKVYKYAMENDIVGKDYSVFVKLPKNERKEKEFFSDLEVKKIENAVSTVKYADYILCMIYTGFRAREFLSLTPFDYDSENNTLKGGMKTEAGKGRIVPVHEKILPIILNQLKLNGDTIFCHENGKRILYKFFIKHYSQALSEIGVRQLTPHACRHTFATMLANNGVDPTTTQKLLGHSKYSTTAEIYVHKDVGALSEGIKKLS